MYQTGTDLTAKLEWLKAISKPVFQFLSGGQNIIHGVHGMNIARLNMNNHDDMFVI